MDGAMHRRLHAAAISASRQTSIQNYVSSHGSRVFIVLTHFLLIVRAMETEVRPHFVRYLGKWYRGTTRRAVDEFGQEALVVSVADMNRVLRSGARDVAVEDAIAVMLQLAQSRGELSRIEVDSCDLEGTEMGSDMRELYAR